MQYVNFLCLSVQNKNEIRSKQVLLLFFSSYGGTMYLDLFVSSPTHQIIYVAYKNVQEL